MKQFMFFKKISVWPLSKSNTDANYVAISSTQSFYNYKKKKLVHKMQHIFTISFLCKFRAYETILNPLNQNVISNKKLVLTCRNNTEVKNLKQPLINIRTLALFFWFVSTILLIAAKVQKCRFVVNEAFITILRAPLLFRLPKQLFVWRRRQPVYLQIITT